MIERKTTLVLGAGASAAFYYPIGSGLRKSLIGLHTRGVSFAAGFKPDLADLHEFARTFEGSQMVSIDAFLARRPEFSEVGKRAIAASLLGIEDHALLFNTKHVDNWYQHLFQEIAADRWGNLDFRNLSIVTFNYDRSLENYLLGALMHSYGKSSDEVVEKLGELRVMHIYGTLGGALPGSPNYIPYGSPVTPENVSIAAAAIKVIPEGRADDDQLRAAQNALYCAEAICFLGFSFDETNLERLNAGQTCPRYLVDAGRNRTVVGTCFEMTVEEIRRASYTLNDAFVHHSGKSPPEGFYDLTCLPLLRETQILKAPWQSAADRRR
jgi:hypothetical protein